MYLAIMNLILVDAAAIGGEGTADSWMDLSYVGDGGGSIDIWGC